MPDLFFGDVMALTEELNKEWNVLGMTGIRSGKSYRKYASDH